jgi:predicted  nucleic acid-binding Zn-ribbon protein
MVNHREDARFILLESSLNSIHRNLKQGSKRTSNFFISVFFPNLQKEVSTALDEFVNLEQKVKRLSIKNLELENTNSIFNKGLTKKDKEIFALLDENKKLRIELDKINTRFKQMDLDIQNMKTSLSAYAKAEMEVATKSAIEKSVDTETPKQEAVKKTVKPLNKRRRGRPKKS